MSKLFVFIFTVIAMLCASAAEPPTFPAVTIRHISSAGPQQGYCSQRFGIGSVAGRNLGVLRLELTFTDSHGRVVNVSHIEVTLDGSTAGRYREEFAESENLCGGPFSVIITSAVAIKDGQSYDLIKLGKLEQHIFEPWPIKVGE